MDDTGEGPVRLPQGDEHQDSLLVNPVQKQGVVIVQEFVEEVATTGFQPLFPLIGGRLQGQVLGGAVTPVHFIVAVDFGMGPENMAQQAGVGPHVAEKKDSVTHHVRVLSDP